MYDHTVRQMQHFSTRDHIKPHLQIDPFPGREQDYPPYGYTGHLPPGYYYRYGPPPSVICHDFCDISIIYSWLYDLKQLVL